jgi:hypothetical protein
MLQDLKWAHTLAHINTHTHTRARARVCKQMHRYLHTKTALVMFYNIIYSESGSNDFRYTDSYVVIPQVLLLKEAEKNA